MCMSTMINNIETILFRISISWDIPYSTCVRYYNDVVCAAAHPSNIIDYIIQYIWMYVQNSYIIWQVACAVYNVVEI